MIRWVIEKIVGIELRRENFNPEWNRIVSCIAVIIASYLILVMLFPVIDNLNKSSEQPWYTAILTKYSFVAVSIRIIFISLFTNLDNPLGRFKAALSLQLISFVAGVVMHSLLSGFIYPSPNISPILKFTYGLLPFAVNTVVFVVVKQVYERRDFNEDEFFQQTRN